MRVSSLFIILCLASAAVLLITSPAIAFEHPWEEGEGGGSLPGDGTPEDDIPPEPGENTPLWSSTNGTQYFWWQIVWEYISVGDALNAWVVNSDTDADPEIVVDSGQRQAGSTLR